ncbi:MAG: hypothetical protein K2X32_08455 [Phycisphaerales bacterium]|nr:hypothetical protein [Phycisphaerales bacterium]
MRSSGNAESFSIHGLSILLLLGLLGLCAYIVYYRLNINIPGAVSTMSQSKVIVTYVTIALVVAGVAGGIGALVYLVSKRSVAAANLAISLVLLLAIGTLGYSLYNNMQSVEAMRQRAAAGNARTTAPGTSGAAATPNPRTPTPPPARLNIPTPPAMPGLQPAPTPPTPTPAPITPNTPRPAPAPTQPKSEDPAIATTIEAFEKELDGQIESLAAQAASVLPQFAKRPARDRVQLENRIRDCDLIDRDAKAVSDRLLNPSAELLKRLTDAGVDSAAAGKAANIFGAAGARRPMLHPLARVGFIADAARDEAKLLLDNYNSWRIERNEIESKDFAIKSRLRGARSRTEAMTRDIDEIVSALRGK